MVGMSVNRTRHSHSRGFRWDANRGGAVEMPRIWLPMRQVWVATVTSAALPSCRHNQLSLEEKKKHQAHPKSSSWRVMAMLLQNRVTVIWGWNCFQFLFLSYSILSAVPCPVMPNICHVIPIEAIRLLYFKGLVISRQVIVK